MNPSENASTVLHGHPFQLALFWWGMTAQAVQTLWAVHRITSACFDRLGRASVAAGLSTLWPLSAAAGVPTTPTSPPHVPDPEHPVTPHPGPDPFPPDINDPPPVEVPPPMQEPPVMPTPVAQATHEVFGEADSDSERTNDHRMPPDPGEPGDDRSVIDVNDSVR